MQGYGTADVARLLHIPPRKVRALARSGVLRAGRGPRGRYQFSFQDLVLLHAARELTEARVPSARVYRALRSLKRQLPSDLPLSGLRIAALGDRIVVRDGTSAWHPESGQLTLDFNVADLATQVAPLVQRRARAHRERQEPLVAEDWFELGLELEESAPAEAIVAYRRCIDLDHDHAEALVNLGRLMQAQGRRHEAEKLYRQARAVRPDLTVAAFNLGTVLDELHRPREAMAAYQTALDNDPDLADAHYNLALLHEQAGNRVAAYRHLRRYRELTGRRKR
jgi:tetratricopeptide (TPR) repeat protein